MVLSAGCSSSFPGSRLPLSADLVAEDKVGNEPQREEEDGKDDEVLKELDMLDAKLFWRPTCPAPSGWPPTSGSETCRLRHSEDPPDPGRRWTE